MNTTLSNRLNAIEARISSSAFLRSEGVANEIPFYIFDYPPEEEVSIRDHLNCLLKRLKEHYKLNVLHVNLLEFLIDYLKEKNIYNKCFDKEMTEGEERLRDALKAPLKAENLVRQFRTKYNPSDHNMVIVSGVGSVYPLIRSHSLLNNLQPAMGDTPLVIFYPGKFDGKFLKLFGKLESNPYYRAIRLIP